MAPVTALLSTLLLFITTLVPAAPAPPDRVWPQFRGPAGRAVSSIDTLPTKWSTTINVAWRADVPGPARVRRYSSDESSPGCGLGRLGSSPSD